MTVVEKIGNLFTANQPAVAQGVNCFGVMGAGIAVQFKRDDPEMFKSYVEACRTGELAPGGAHFWQKSDGTWTFNLASQNRPGKDARIEWFESALREASEFATLNNITGIAMPRIGAGIGGLQWDDCLEMIKRVDESFPHLTYEIWARPEDLV